MCEKPVIAVIAGTEDPAEKPAREPRLTRACCWVPSGHQNRCVTAPVDTAVFLTPAAGRTQPVEEMIDVVPTLKQTCPTSTPSCPRLLGGFIRSTRISHARFV
jgi:hypothetical protein